jgi:hypothetical protein
MIDFLVTPATAALAGQCWELRDDLVDWLARAELRADMPVAAALTGAGDDEIAHPGQPGEGVAVTAHASPSFDISRTARVITVARVFSPIPSE